MSDEKLYEKIKDIQKRLSKLEDAVFGEESSFSNTKGIERTIVEKIEEIKTQHLIVISLKLKGNQTRDELKKTLQDWGKVFGNWFRGGNFKNRLLTPNIVKVIEKNEKGKDVFSLTQKGNLLAEDLIKKIEK